MVKLTFYEVILTPTPCLAFQKKMMSWNYLTGCTNCTWQEEAIVCGLAVLTAAIFGGWLLWMARRYENQGED